MWPILIDALTLIVCTMAATGCGKEELAIELPTPTPVATQAPSTLSAATPTPTATPTPNPTVVTYSFFNILICGDIKTWNPTTTTIKTYGTSGNGPSYYLLRWDGAFLVGSGGCENGCVPPDTDLVRSDINGVVCTIRIRNGQYAGVTP